MAKNIEKDKPSVSIDTEYFDSSKNQDRIDKIPFGDNQKSLSYVIESVEALNQEINKTDENECILKYLYDFAVCRDDFYYCAKEYKEVEVYSEKVFSMLEGIKVDSFYLNRFIDELKIIEAQNCLDDGDFTKDEGDWVLSESGVDKLNQYPEKCGLYEYALDKFNKCPDLTITDNYLRNNDWGIDVPYVDFLGSCFLEKELLLGMETASIFCVEQHEIPKDVYIQLYRFGINLNEEKYNKVKEITSHNTSRENEEMMEVLLAMEFGDDFGDSILTIAEYAKPNESREVFRIINEYRDFCKDFSGQFDNIDLELSSGAEKAMIERLTDLLVVAAEVAKNGSLIVDTAPHRDNEDYYHDGKFDIKIDSLSQVIDTMDTFSRSQELIWCIMNSSDTCITERYRKDADKIYSQTYSLINDKLGVAQFHVRRFGASSFDRVVEHGNYNGTEATISWSVNPNNPFRYPDLKDPDCMNIRFDREGRSINEAPNSPDRLPIRDDGIISLDIGSVLGEKTSASTIIGRTIAAGNILRSENKDNNGIDISLNHNTNYLPQEYGNANDFAWLATMMEQKIVNSYEHINNKNIRKIAKSLVEKSVQIAI